MDKENKEDKSVVMSCKAYFPFGLSDERKAHTIEWYKGDMLVTKIDALKGRVRLGTKNVTIDKVGKELTLLTLAVSMHWQSD